MRGALRTVLLLDLLLLPAAVQASRLVAIGDVHGAYPQLVELLQATELIDTELRWSGGTAVLVQTGDLLDRGGQPFQVLDLMMRLQGEAAAAGGRVVVLMGNHEAMNLVGDLRYVTPEIYGSMADERSDRRLQRAWREWTGLVRQIARERQVPPRELTSEQQERFFEQHPPGYFAYRDALSPQSEYGRWLRSLPAVAQVGDSVFVHGGVSPQLASLGVDTLNRRAAAEVDAFDRSRAELVDEGLLLPWLDLGETLSVLRAHAVTWEARPDSRQARRIRDALALWEGLSDSLLMGEEGPLWYRGYARWSEEEGAALTPQVLDALGVRAIVAGHSPPETPGRIWSRFGGRLFLIDTGMLPGYHRGGRPAALEIGPDGVVAVYLDGREPLPEASLLLRRDDRASAEAAAERSATPPEALGRPVERSADPAPLVWMGPDGRPLPFTLPEEVERFLAEAEVVEHEVLTVGINRPRKLLLERGGVRAHAVFRDVDEEKHREELTSGVVYFFKDSYRSEVAAYRLSRLLGMDNVPPAVLRNLFGEKGSVQLWIEDATMERDRIEQGNPLPPGVQLEVADTRVFDNLIGNIDRNQGNILYDPAGKLWLIDHTRSFSRWTRLPAKEKVRHCSRRLWEDLQALSAERLEEVMGDALYRGEIRALLDRRDQVVKLLQERISERGEERVILDHMPSGGVTVLPSRPVDAAAPPVP